MADWNIGSSVKEKERGRSIMVWPEMITPKSRKSTIKKIKIMPKRKKMALLLKVGGFNGREIASEIKVSTKTVYRWIKSVLNNS